MSIPNILTLLRIAIIPIILVLLINGSSQREVFWAFMLFVISALTDFFDGWLARKLKQESDFGRLFDPIADKMLIIAVYFALVGIQVIAGWNILAVILIVSRELLVSALREYLAERNVTMPPSQQSKYKTALQLIVTAALIISPMFNENFLNYTLLSLWIVAAFTIFTGFNYIIDEKYVLLSTQKFMKISECILFDLKTLIPMRK